MLAEGLPESWWSSRRFQLTRLIVPIFEDAANTESLQQRR